jgi:transposase
MKTLSLDLRERIVAAYDAEEGSREEIGRRFRVSLGMVKKLLAQRRRTGEIGPRHYCCGRKPLIVEEHRQRLQQMLKHKPGLTLEQMRRALSITCSLPAIHYALVKMGLTYKKRRSGLLSRTEPT